MTQAWQDCWTFRIVDQETGAAVTGVPVTVLPEGKSEGGYWVSDADGLVRVPKHDHARLRLRVGLRNEETIELDARSLPDDPVPLTAPHGVPTAGPESAPRADRSSPEIAAALSPPPGHLIRFARLVVLAEDQDVAATPDPSAIGAAESPEPTSIRYGAVLEVDQVWQAQGPQPGDVFYSVSLGPGEEVKLVVSDGRWRKKPDARERPLQIVSRMVAARQLADAVDAVPLEPAVTSDLGGAASETVRLLAERTARAGEALRRRPLGITELEGEKPAGATIRTLRNMRSEGVLSYHFVEPVERYHVIVRTPRLRAAMLVPFRMPAIATRDVVRRFGHTLRRAVLDRSFAADVDKILGSDDPPAAAERRLYKHITEHLTYYSATIIAAGDPAERFFALAKLKDAQGRPLTDVIENVVVGRVGNYVAFPLRSLSYAPPAWRTALRDETVRRVRAFEELTVTLPLPGVWLRSELYPAQVAAERVPTSESVRPAKGLRG